MQAAAYLFANERKERGLVLADRLLLHCKSHVVVGHTAVYPRHLALHLSVELYCHVMNDSVHRHVAQ